MKGNHFSILPLKISAKKESYYLRYKSKGTAYYNVFRIDSISIGIEDGISSVCIFWVHDYIDNNCDPKNDQELKLKTHVLILEDILSLE